MTGVKMMKKIWILLFIIVSIILATGLYASGDGSEAKIITDSNQVTMTPEEAGIYRDSIFAIINHSYLNIKPMIQNSCFVS